MARLSPNVLSGAGDAERADTLFRSMEYNAAYEVKSDLEREWESEDRYATRPSRSRAAGLYVPCAYP